MKKLSRQPMRPEEEPGVDKEVWQPGWHCFCCHDTGIVASHLAATVIEGYNYNRDKFPRCQNLGCASGSHFDGQSLTKCVDYRLTPEICLELDKIERESWKDWAKEQQQRLNKVNTSLSVITEGMSMRKRSRSPEEEMLAKRRHLDAIAQ